MPPGTHDLMRACDASRRDWDSGYFTALAHVRAATEALFVKGVPDSSLRAVLSEIDRLTKERRR